MIDARALDTVYGFAWAFSFALSIFFVNTAWGEIKTAPEAMTTHWGSLILVFMLPLVVNAVIWMVGRIVDKIYLLTTGWFGCLYSMFYTVYFLVISIYGIFNPTAIAATDMMTSLLAFGWIVLPFLLPGIIVWFLLRRYSTEYKNTKKDFVYIFGYFYMGLVFMLQFYAYTFLIV